MEVSVHRHLCTNSKSRHSISSSKYLTRICFNREVPCQVQFTPRWEYRRKSITIQEFVDLDEIFYSNYDFVPAKDRKYPQTNLPQGYVAYPDIGFAYKVHNLLVTWPQARSRCIEEGAQLALIDSQKKVEYVRNQKTRRNWAWSGLLRMYDGKKWVAERTGRSILQQNLWALTELTI